jgi:hypothetical protein
VTEDDRRVLIEIDRRALETTDPGAMQLFTERELLAKQLRTVRIGASVAAVVAGLIAWLAVLPAGEWTFLESCAIALAAFWIVLVIGRKSLDSRFDNWMTRARKAIDG